MIHPTEVSFTALIGHYTIDDVDEFLTRVNLKLAIDMGEVRLGGSLRDMQLLLDKGKRSPPSQQFGHVALPRREGESILKQFLLRPWSRRALRVGSPSPKDLACGTNPQAISKSLLLVASTATTTMRNRKVTAMASQATAPDATARERRWERGTPTTTAKAKLA